MSIFEITGENVQEINIKIDDMWNARSGYHIVYVSIGSKINEQKVCFNRPTNIKQQSFCTNALNQMLPQFLRYRSEEQNILSIIIDEFSTEKQVNTNFINLHKNIDENTDILMINNHCTKIFLEEFIHTLMHILLRHNVCEKHVMLCNYVKFLNNPNAIESNAEQMIPKTIQSVLDRPEYARYSYCFHEWFGYRFYLYNFIYNYKRCLLSYNCVGFIEELEMFMKSQYQDNMKSTAVVQNINTIRFWESIYDITAMAECNNKIATNLTEYLLENRQLERAGVLA
jgi:hypothetical protein